MKLIPILAMAVLAIPGERGCRRRIPRTAAKLCSGAANCRLIKLSARTASRGSEAEAQLHRSEAKGSRTNALLRHLP